MAKAALVSVSFVAAPALDEDGRNIYGSKVAAEYGFTYYQIGVK